VVCPEQLLEGSDGTTLRVSAGSSHDSGPDLLPAGQAGVVRLARVVVFEVRARNLQNMIARGNRRRESVLSNQHRLLGEDTRHRAIRCCQGDRGHAGVGEVAGGVDAGHAGFAALVDLEGDAEGRIDRGEAQ